ncbi:MAG: alkaline phosphatase family protein [Verrucomicrobia bacterium]|nr:alkaline phosphatase family protein [Verrucomicrobiota bacterium]
MPVRFCALFVLLSSVLPLPAAETSPRLAVVITIDQFRGDYLAKFGPHFGEGGFRRLLANGVHFSNCHHRHSVMLTAPGHASILTGVFANVHGVTANEWLDRGTWEMVNSVEDRRAPLVGIAPAELGPVAAAAPAKTGRSPANLKAETVGDLLKRKHGNGTKIFAASNKDRSAILLGGHRADAAYWDENGKIVTSRHYRAELPAWVEAFNAERRVHATFGRTWDRLREPALYDRVQGPDDAPGEADTAGLGRTFPRRVTGGKEAISPAFFTAFDNSPFSAEFLGEFVQRAVREEKLGRNTATDLLCVSFSQVDAIGHNYGPDSHEMMDSVLRLDRVLAGLLDCLEKEVGLDRCLIVLTADHGIVPLPEHVQATRPGTPSGRIKTTDMDAAARKALDAKFGAPAGREVWFTRDNAGIHLRPAVLQAKGIAAADAARVIQQAWRELPYIAAVYTREDLDAADASGDTPLAMMRRSYRGAEDRDVVYVLKPYFLAKAGGGASHGAPYDYDQHVVLLWSGAGVPRGERAERVGVDSVAPTLAALLGVAAPNGATGRRLF